MWVQKPPIIPASAPCLLNRGQYKSSVTGARKLVDSPLPVKTITSCKNAGGLTAASIAATPTATVTAYVKRLMVRSGASGLMLR